MNNTSKAHTPTSAEVLKRQEAEAARDRAAVQAALAANSSSVHARVAPRSRPLTRTATQNTSTRLRPRQWSGA